MLLMPRTPDGPPAYPLTVDQFRDAVRKGLGRAVIHLRSVPDTTPYRDIVREACLRDQRFEVSVESSRNVYLADLTSMCRTPMPLADELMALLAAPPDETDEWLLADVVLELARRGDARARMAWWAHVRSLAPSELCAYGRDLIELGRTGVVFLAERVGADLPEDELWRYNHWLSEVDERFGEGSGQGWLVEAAAGSQRVSEFLNAAEAARSDLADASEPEPPDDDPTLTPWETVWADIAVWAASPEGGSMPRNFRWAKHAPDESIAAAAQMFLEESDERLLRALAAILRVRQWPLDIALLIAKMETVGPELTDRVMWAARSTSDPALRTECLKRLADGRLSGRLLHLFRANYQPGDAKAIESALATAHLDDEAIHSMGHDLLELFTGDDAHRDGEALLVWLYEHTPCGFCRGGVVGHIATTGGSASWILEEAIHDSEPDTRAAAGRR